MLSFLCVYQCWSGMYKLVPCINTGIKDPTRLVELRQYQPCRDLSEDQPWTSFIPVSIPEIIYLPHNQPEISLGPNIRTRLF
jgi:hypothetical protein